MMEAHASVIPSDPVYQTAKLDASPYKQSKTRTRYQTCYMLAISLSGVRRAELVGFGGTVSYLGRAAVFGNTFDGVAVESK